MARTRPAARCIRRGRSPHHNRHPHPLPTAHRLSPASYYCGPPLSAGFPPLPAFHSASRLSRRSRNPGFADTSSPAVPVWLFARPVSQSRIALKSAAPGRTGLSLSGLRNATQRFWGGRGVPRLSQSRWGGCYLVLLTIFPVSVTLRSMNSLLQTGSGMISAYAYRGRPGVPKSDFLSIFCILHFSLL